MMIVVDICKYFSVFLRFSLFFAVFNDLIIVLLLRFFV